MSLLTEPSELTLDEIEAIEKLTLRWIFQAALDFGDEAYEIFRLSPDDVKDVAEDVTREMLDRLPVQYSTAYLRNCRLQESSLHYPAGTKRPPGSVC